MVLYITESDVHHPWLVVIIHVGGVSGWLWEQQISYFRHFRGSVMEHRRLKPMLFNRTLDAWLSVHPG
ncbi:hypothetical protein MOF33_14610 [Bacillus spizizenii]|nr:hypothetical protein [Bacillus spizizenii]